MRENTNLPQGDNNSEQEPQMMICPKAKECTYKKHVCNIPEDEGRYFPPTYWHCDMHPYNQSCDHHKAHGKVGCPACIPVEPEPTKMFKFDTRLTKKSDEPQPEPTCLDCARCGHIKEAHLEGYGLNYFKDGKERLCMEFQPPAEPDSRKVEKPTPTMPLIDATMFIIPTGAAMAQREADMAWHNEKVQQVRKEFAKQVVAFLEEHGLTLLWRQQIMNIAREEGR